jgi:deaminated glutathione amidase
MSKLKIGIAQLNSNDDCERNLQQILSLLNGLNSGVDIVFFPENSLFFRINEKDSVQYLSLESKEFKAIASVCAEKKIFVHLGSVAFMENGVPSNSSILITPSLKVIRSYTKIHLFDIQLNQDKAIRESDCFRRGETPNIFTLKGWRFGQSICYDIRFSELYRYYNSMKVDVLLIPAAFLKKTGAVHWHILNQARAIESQAFVVSSAQMGPHTSKQGSHLVRETFGHGLCVSPWGEILADIETVPTIKVIELDKSLIENVKKQIPMDDHRWINAHAWKANEIDLEKL